MRWFGCSLVVAKSTAMSAKNGLLIKTGRFEIPPDHNFGILIKRHFNGR